MACIVLNVFKIVNVINHNFEVVSFFKKILNVKAPDPSRIQVVINYFSLADFVPSWPSKVIKKSAYPDLIYKIAIPSVLLKVSRFGRFSHEKLNVIRLTKPYVSLIVWLVAASTASSRSRPIAFAFPLFIIACAFECFLQHLKASPNEAQQLPIINKIN